MNPALRNVILAAVVAAVFAGGLWWFHYVPDNAYLGMRYAGNLAAGEGLVFNPGERVEGYTDFLWIVILAALAKTGIPLVPGARILSLLFSAGTLILAWRFCDRMIPENEKRTAGAGVAFAAPLILAASAPFVTWALSGTGVPLFTFLLTAGMLLISTGGGVIPVFTVFALLNLASPEGAPFYLLAALLLLIRGEKARDVAARGTGIAALLLAPYLVWKIYWFGSILPNAFYMMTGAAAQQLRNGLAYTARFAAWYVWLPAAALLFMRLSRRGEQGNGEFVRTAVPLSIILLNWIIVTISGGGWMPQYRLLVPCLPAISVMAAAAVPRIVIYQQKNRQSGGGAWQSLALAVIFASMVMAPGSSGYDAFKRERLAVRAFGWVGETLGKRYPEGTRIGCGSTGAVGYFSGLPVIDILGLTEPEIARNGKIVSKQPGHMKALGSHVLDRKPDLLLLGNIQIHRGKRPEDLDRIKVQERDIILDPRFSSGYEFMNLPLEGGFYLSCYGRSGSAVLSE